MLRMGTSMFLATRQKPWECVQSWVEYDQSLTITISIEILNFYSNFREKFKISMHFICLKEVQHQNVFWLGKKHLKWQYFALIGGRKISKIMFSVISYTQLHSVQRPMLLQVYWSIPKYIALFSNTACFQTIHYKSIPMVILAFYLHLASWNLRAYVPWISVHICTNLTMSCCLRSRSDCRNVQNTWKRKK